VQTAKRDGRRARPPTTMAQGCSARAAAACTIGRAKPSDAEAMAACSTALADEIIAAQGESPLGSEHRASPQRAAANLRSRGYRAFVARSGDRVVGLITMTEVREAVSEPDGWISECYVEANWRAAGVGASLVHAAQCEARWRGWWRIRVACPPLEAFVGTRRFYEREGFRALDERTLVLVL